VSNSVEKRDLSDNRAGHSVTIRKATKTETHACLRLILGTAGELASEEQVTDFLRFALYRHINLQDLYLAERRGVIVWAILPVVSPGRTMVLFCPGQVAPTLQDTIVPGLIARLLADFATRGVHLAQVLLDSSDSVVIRLFESIGFSRLAELLYLNRELRRLEQPTLPNGYRLLRYGPGVHSDFARTIAATYHQSLDCPALNGRRDMEDILEGHKAVGQFDANLWSLLCDGNVPIAVSLLNRSPHTEAIELVYFGLIPSMRGRGIGDLLMQHAFYTAHTANARYLTLAVDSRNLPALKLYRRHGLREVCSRIALLQDLRELRVDSEPFGDTMAMHPNF